MYSTCIFCNSTLGSNEVIEHFPVGRRLAFDPARGRLWAVCLACGRWNLAPLEERWEAIESCERAFAGTRLRVSTDHVGLARLREGLELVRIGEPQRPELAAWRYGDQLGRRRRRALWRAGLGVGLVGAVVAGGASAGVGVGTFWLLGHRMLERAVKGSPDAVVARLPDHAGMLEVRRKDVHSLALQPGATPGDVRLLVEVRREVVRFTGPDALWAAGRLLPSLNQFGGTQRQVATAVELLEDAASPLRCFAAAARTGNAASVPLRHVAYPIRLALEMAAHEEQERRALQGELALLEAAWREAEEIAAIADSLLLPPAMDQWLRRLRGA